MALEIGLAVLILLVFVAGLSWRGQDKRRLGVLVAIGLAILLWMAFRAEPGATLFRGTFVQDELAIFSKRLFLLATILGVLASLSLRAPTFAHALLMLARLGKLTFETTNLAPKVLAVLTIGFVLHFFPTRLEARLRDLRAQLAQEMKEKKEKK